MIFHCRTGLSEVVLAARIASQKNMRILILDKRDHIGVNCHEYIDENEILLNKYGANLFHTNDPDVWEYIKKSGELEIWDHRVLGSGVEKLININGNN